jgi:hydrogenase nickel incorporation protein HypA/HybF
VHEVGLMLEALALAEERARGHEASRIHRLTLRVGRLSGVDAEALTFAFDACAEGTLAEGAQLVIEEEPVSCWCARCQTEFQPADIIFACPACGELSPDIRRGRELELTSLEVS